MKNVKGKTIREKEGIIIKMSFKERIEMVKKFNKNMDATNSNNISSISIDDDYQFHTHVDVLKLFGKSFRAHMQATYKLDEDWRVWFPKLYRNGDFVNELLDGGKIVEMNQLPGSLIIGMNSFPEDQPGKRIIFAHFIDPVSKEKYYKFIGVFTELIGNMQHASCQRIATKMYLDGKGRFSINPLTG